MDIMPENKKNTTSKIYAQVILKCHTHFLLRILSLFILKPVSFILK